VLFRSPALSQSLQERLGREVDDVGLDVQLHFSRHGHACTRQIFDGDEMDELRGVIENAVEVSEFEAWQWTVRSHFGEAIANQMEDVFDCQDTLDGIPVAFLQHFNLWRQSEGVRALTHSPRIAKVAASLLGTKRVRLYQDAVFVKRPGDSTTRWHADLHMAPFDTNGMVTCWLPLRPVLAQADGGTGLMFISGSQRDVALGFWRKEPQKARLNLEGRYGEEAMQDHHGALALGDATWHHGWTLHGAPCLAAEGTSARMALAMTYIADGTRIRGDDVDADVDDEDSFSYRAWLGDLSPGSIAEHELLPLVCSS